MAKSKENKNRYWFCLIGAVEEKKIKNGGDFPLRHAAKVAYQKLTGKDDDVCTSGWGVDEERAELLKTILTLDKSDPLYSLVKEMAKQRFGDEFKQ